MANILPCPVCQADSSMLDVVDFNKNCLEHRGRFLPLSGEPIYYYRCDNCFFTFAPEISNWSAQRFLEQIYNDQYGEVDPDYFEIRPQANFTTLRKIFNEHKKSIRHLDYGGGSGKLSELLTSDGWSSTTYDPFPSPTIALEKLGRFNLITAFEVFEHVPNPHGLVRSILSLMDSESVVLFSTLISDGNINKNERLTWWYASPRNGHISLFSKKSLAILSQAYGLKFGSFSNGFHCFLNEIPEWARHIISAK